MHELGIVFHITKQVEEVAKENNAQHISEVVLSLGEVSTVIPSYLEDCWAWNSKKYPLLEGSKLTCETIKAVTFCEDCKQEYGTVEHGKTCPHCGSTNTYLVTGNEVILKEVIVD
ncbi:MAG: hydrogenase maturation nickel metallochaperone HypA [Pseudobutyrivibrio sp.]|nr:hydrogenase maturation nickel metallochaperone HypA [Pseudobutyrivibrio sp.]